MGPLQSLAAAVATISRHRLIVLRPCSRSLSATMVKQRRSRTVYPRAVAQRPLPSLAESLAAAVATTSRHRRRASTAADRVAGECLMTII